VQVFDTIVVLTQGGPGDASRSIVMYIYEKAFQTFDMGYASALAMTLFAIIMVLTLLQFGLARRWVHYE
jgi:multiple sugar transport system permease protein